MATNTIKTRIALKYDTYENWTKEQPPESTEGKNLKLLAGEIGICEIPSDFTANADSQVMPTILFKVGNGTSKFHELPWASAKAADVYDWAKVQDPSTITVTHGTGDTAKTSTLANMLSKIETNAASISTLGSGKLADITVTPDSNTGIVKSVTKGSAAGEISVAYGTVDTAEITDNAVTTGKIANSAVTDAKIDTVSADKVIYTAGPTPETEITLPEKIAQIDGRLSTITGNITGGVHFVGITNTEIEDGATSTPVITDKPDYVPALGDIVLYNNKEFIWNGSAWEELGDLGRVATLETLTNGLIETAATDNKFVTHITKDASSGKLVVNKAQPTSSNISHTEGTCTTVQETLEAHKTLIGTHTSALQGITGTVVGAITEAISALDYIMPTEDVTETAEVFITGVTQADGKVSTTRKKLPTASTSTSGIVQLSDSNSGTAAADGSDSKTAATTKAVKEINTKAVDAQTRVGTVETDYIRHDSTNNYLVKGKDGTAMIIFNCGSAADV